MKTIADTFDLAKYIGETAANGQAVTNGVPVLQLEQLRAQSEAVRWLVKAVIPMDSLGLLYGGSGTFKSFIALDMALHIAHGLPWLGKKTKRGPVIIVAAEGGAGLWRRIEAWHRKMRLRWQDADLRVIPIALDLTERSASLVEAVKAVGVAPALVVIDTLSQTFSGEENSAQEVSKYLQQIAIWIRGTWQCAVVIVHHSGHQATERPRGSSALRANVDFMFGVFRDEKEMLATLECMKQKDGDMFDAVTFTLSIERLGTDEDGDMVTSLVAQRLSSSDEMLERMEQEAAHGRGGHKQQLLALLQNGMQEKALRSLFYEAVGGDAESKRQSYNRAKKWAIDQRLIEVAEGTVITLRP